MQRHAHPVSPHDHLIAGLEVTRLEIASGDQARLRKKNLPRRIEVHPALCTEPARRYFRNVQQTVTANARKARITAKRKRSQDSRVLSARDTHRKSSGVPSGVGADIRQRSLHRSCAADGVRCATTNPAPSETVSTSGSNSQASTLP